MKNDKSRDRVELLGEYLRDRKPSDGEERAAIDHVWERLLKQPARVLRPRSSPRFGRLVVLVAATAAIAALAQQIATRTSTPVPPVKEEVVTVPHQSTPAVPEPPKPAAPAAKPRLEFAAASIKPVPPGTLMAGAGLACRGAEGVQRLVLTVTADLQDVVKAPLGRCVGSGIFLTTLIEMAYGVSPRQISGGPDWSRVIGNLMTTGEGRGAFVSLPSRKTSQGFSWSANESFQIEATAENPSTATLEQLRQMLQALLADRFKLRFHFEEKVLSGYALVVAERGHKLKSISGEYVESLVLYQGRSTINKLARSLASFLLYEVPLVDKTGLKGAYEYAFELIPPNPQGGRGQGGGGASGGGAPSIADRAENLSARLEEQLGLRLQPEKAMSVEALVIDSVEPPSPN